MEVHVSEQQSIVPTAPLIIATKRLRLLEVRPHSKQLPGLTLLAAPWDYVVSCQVNRLATCGRQSYDLSDAVAYLPHYLQSRRVFEVPLNTVHSWSTKYTLPWSSNNDDVG